MASDNQPGAQVVPALAKIDDDDEHKWVKCAPAISGSVALPVPADPANSQVQIAVARVENDDLAEAANDVTAESMEPADAGFNEGDVSRVRARVVPVDLPPPPFERVRRLDVSCKRLAAHPTPVTSSFKISTLAEAEAYHLHELVGDWIIRVGTETMTVRVPSDEIHVYTTDKVIKGAPTVKRRHHKNEVRHFDIVRARLMQLIFPTIVRKPTKIIRGNDRDSVELLATLEKGRKFIIVLERDEQAPPKAKHVMYRLRTAFEADERYWRQQMNKKSIPWPPK